MSRKAGTPSHFSTFTAGTLRLLPSASPVLTLISDEGAKISRGAGGFPFLSHQDMNGLPCRRRSRSRPSPKPF